MKAELVITIYSDCSRITLSKTIDLEFMPTKKTLFSLSNCIPVVWNAAVVFDVAKNQIDIEFGSEEFFGNSLQIAHEELISLGWGPYTDEDSET